MISSVFNAIAGLVVLASLFGAACLAVVVIFLRERFDRAVENRALQVRTFLDELKADAAYAAVCDFPYSGADLLGMLGRHALITAAESGKLIEDARHRMHDEAAAEEDEPYPRANGHDRSPRPVELPDEIPF